MFKELSNIFISGASVLPLIEGGKGIGVSSGLSAGAWARAGGVGTFSGVNAESYDAEGNLIPQIYWGTTRSARHRELIQYAIEGGVQQAIIAYEMAQGKGRIHMNVLWEMAGVEEIVEGILSRANTLIHGITCGAGMPYRLAQLAAKFQVFYVPIVSSARAFHALWKRAYHKFSDWMGAVVYEDPWLAGGHNGLSNQENPLVPQDPYPRVLTLRAVMRECGLHRTPIIMAGGVWCLKEWERWIDNEELGPIGFQLGTRPLLTQESPISPAWKQRLLTLRPGDVSLNRFSPTGFYSSAVNNAFLQDLQKRSQRQIVYALHSMGDHTIPLEIGQRNRIVYVTEGDYQNALRWQSEGFDTALRTPDATVIFVSSAQAASIQSDQVNCMGCLSQCRFSNWDQVHGGTGLKPDPRSFCIQKTLQTISRAGSVEENLMFAGHNAFRFGEDPLYANGFIPTVQQLVECLCTGE